MPSLGDLTKPSTHLQPLQEPQGIDRSLLSESDSLLLDSLSADAQTAPATLDNRLGNLASSLGPIVDLFVDGVNKVAQYREAADRVAGRMLRMCAEKLEERDHEGRRRAFGPEGLDSEKTHDDLAGVLRSLSRIER